MRLRADRGWVHCPPREDLERLSSAAHTHFPSPRSRTDLSSMGSHIFLYLPSDLSAPSDNLGGHCPAQPFMTPSTPFYPEHSKA